MLHLTTPLQAQCFLDLRPGRGLCHILGTAYKFKAEQGWWVAPSKGISYFIVSTCNAMFWTIFIFQAEVWPAESIQNWMECGDVPCYWESFDPGALDRFHSDKRTNERQPNWIYIFVFCVCVCVYRTTVCQCLSCIWILCWIRNLQADLLRLSLSIR